MASRIYVACALAFAACKKDPLPAPPPPPAPAPVPVAPADAPPPIGPLVELLHHTKAIVAVSSTVLNPKIQPEQLVDGKLATAWNSRTGDLAGAWIAFRVPADAHVTQVKLTAGFDAKGPEGDYFTLNHRVHGIRITRAGKVLATRMLDLDTRGLQTIAVDAPGGDFRIEVTSVFPGTKKTWREACVSELEVWGTTPAPLATPAAPTVTIGSLDTLAHDPMTGPFPSIASFCELWSKPIAEGNAERAAECKATPTDDCRFSGAGGTPRCVDHESLAEPAGAFRGARVVELDNGDGFDGNFPCVLFVGTRAGWFPTEQVRCTSGEGTNVSFTTNELVVRGGKLVWSYTVDESITGDKSHDDIEVSCEADDDGNPSCTSAPKAP